MHGRDADPASRRTILDVDQPQPNHNGGQLAFGPDGYLYIGLGDGGAQGDEGSGHAPGGNGQSLDTLLGKILRIDPNPSRGDAPYTVPADNPFVGDGDARPEIWAYGLRNPWRFSFDRDTGDLWIGDVGQNEWEEIDHARRDRTAATPGRGDNFGWNRLGGHARVPRRARPRTWSRPSTSISHDDRRVLGHRRLRLPRHRDPGARRQVPVHRLLRRRGPRARRRRRRRRSPWQDTGARLGVGVELRPGQRRHASTWLSPVDGIFRVDAGIHPLSSCAACSVEDDGAAAVDEHAVLDVGADGAGEHDDLEVAAAPLQVVDRVAVADAHDVLVDDRAVVELGGRVVRGDTRRVFTPRSCAWWYGRPPLNAGRNEWWMLMMRVRPPVARSPALRICM